MNQNFNFTIAVCPSSLNLDRELEFAKSALLYADNVTLLSPMAYLFIQLTDESILKNESKQLTLLKRVFQLCRVADPVYCETLAPTLCEFERVIRSPNYRSLPFVQKLPIKKSLNDFAREVNSVVLGLIGEFACDEIKLLVSKGIIKIQKFNHLIDDAEGCITEYFSKLRKSITNSFSLFDEQSNDLIGAADQSKVINITSMQKYKSVHAGLADSLITRLPSFEKASINEILDIRKELSKPLIRFRSKILKYTDTMQALPWDRDFEDECHILYEKEINPSLLELEERSKNNSFLRNLGSSFLTDNSALEGGLLIGIAAAGIIPAFTQAMELDTAAWVAGGALATSKITKAYKEYANTKKEIGNNDLFFYYKASNLLQK